MQVVFRVFLISLLNVSVHVDRTPKKPGRPVSMPSAPPCHKLTYMAHAFGLASVAISAALREAYSRAYTLCPPCLFVNSSCCMGRLFYEEQLDGSVGGDEAEGPSDVSGSAVATGAIKLEVTSLLPGFADRAVGLGEHGGLGGEDRGDPPFLAGVAGKVEFLTQLLPHPLQEGIPVGPGQIHTFHLRGIAPPSGRTYSHHLQPPLPAFGQQQAFLRNGIDTIHDHIRSCIQKFPTVLLGKEPQVGLHVCPGRKTVDPLGHGLDLHPPHRGIRCMDLTVHIGHANLIQIDEVQMPDSGTGKGLRRPAPNPSNSNHHHPASLQPGQSGPAQQAFGSADPRRGLVWEIHSAGYCLPPGTLQENSLTPMPTSSQKRVLFHYRWWLLALYFCLLIASRVASRPDPFEPILETPPSKAGVLVLLDPMAESTPVFDMWIEEARDSGVCIRVPELPGINTPSMEVLTFEALAENLPPAPVPEHVLANGEAGVIALHLAGQRPEEVSSLVLVDASGVQEFTLLGNRHLNRALYQVGGAGLALYDRFVPHFGFPRDLALRRSQLQLYTNSDRRVIRPILQTIEQPVSIIETNMDAFAHSRNEEHARLIPQSKLIVVEPGQLPDALAAAPGPVRMDADRMRLKDAEKDFDPATRPRLEGGLLALTLLAIALATLISEDATGAITGLMIANGNLSAVHGIAACLAGILFGDSLLYLAGRHWGRPALSRIPLRWMIDPLQLRETEDWFSRHAGKAILISRCIPGTRVPALVAAGILGVSPGIFTFWFVLAGAIWTPAYIGITILLSERALIWIEQYQHAAPGLLICGVALYFLISHILLPSLNWRGRRKLLGRFRRWTRPEYWPTWILYLPVAVQLLLRGFRKGNHHLDFTACNPCMPISGLVEESKSEILDQVGDQNSIAPYQILKHDLAPEERERLVDTFLGTQLPAFPVVAKPDKGQRGTDVVIAHSREELDGTLADHTQDWILQKYILGEEFGIFVILPPEGEGFLFGINGKRFPKVEGDGEHSLEDLILADPRAVCQAPMLLRAHAENLYRVPEAGERIPLTEVGNHSRGTEFLECSDLITP